MKIPKSKKIKPHNRFIILKVARLEWKPGGPRLGLGIKHYQNRVLVSRCDPGSLASQQLQVGDHLIDIDGRPVTDKDVCRELLLKSLQVNRFVTSVVERPETMEARHWVQSALTASAAQAPSVAMNSDVRAIAARERKKLQKTVAVSISLKINIFKIPIFPISPHVNISLKLESRVR